MKIGFLLSSIYAIGNPGNGILAQAKSQACALRKLGCDVSELNPWDVQSLDDFDVIQFFQGGLSFHNVEHCRQRLKNGILVFAPIIDTNQPNGLYRIASKAGSLFDKVYTVPSEFKVQADNADLIICRSQHESDRITQGLDIDDNKVEIVLNGTDVPDSSALDNTHLREKYNLPEKFILHVSSYADSRKNVLKLVEAVSELDLPLIIAGNAQKGETLDRLKSMVSGRQGISMMGFVERDLLDAMYSCCHVFCLPSIHEGTGLVALEAGIKGANIIITQNGGPPDYFGDFVEYVDPGSLESIKNALTKSWNKDKSSALISHINSFLKWDDSATQLLSCYERYLEIKMSNKDRL